MLLNRRQCLQAGWVAALTLALPWPLRAAVVSNTPPRSEFDGDSTAEEVTAGLNLSGLTIAITGANSGLGLETLRVLAMRGAHVLAIARTREKAERACAQVGGHTTPLHLDLGDWESVAACAEHIRGMDITLDGLICNAGIMGLPELQRINGIERQFAINHLGHFILIRHLQPLLMAAPQGRCTLLSSQAHRRAENGIEFDNLDGSKHYDPWVAYATSKLANALCARALAARMSDSRATANSVHPGVIMTNLGKHLPRWQQVAGEYLGWMFMKTVEEGAATTCYVATSPELVGVRGYYFADCNVAEDEGYLYDDAMAEQLWQVSTELTRDYLPTKNA